MRQRHRKLTEAELTERVRALLVSLAYPPAYSYSVVPVLEVVEWVDGLELDGWPANVKADSILGVDNTGTPETYGHHEAADIVSLLCRRSGGRK